MGPSVRKMGGPGFLVGMSTVSRKTRKTGGWHCMRDMMASAAGDLEGVMTEWPCLLDLSADIQSQLFDSYCIHAGSFQFSWINTHF